MSRLRATFRTLGSARALGLAGLTASIFGVCGCFRSAAAVMLVGNIYALIHE